MRARAAPASSGAASASTTSSASCAATARASMVMDHGRFGPSGAQGGADGGVNKVEVRFADGRRYVPPHLSKDQGIELGAGDVVAVSTPGGGGFGDPARRDPKLIEQDFRRGYYPRKLRR